jgi:hypothetical protein
MRINQKWLFATIIAVALIVSPFAVAAGEGDPLEGGTRNPSTNQSQALTRETEVIANTATYGTRQSNKSNNGGGAIYGCRATQGTNPCLRAVNLANGRAFEFQSTATEAGRIDVGGGGDSVRPFSTNATGVATGLNADRVDGFDQAQLVARFARVAQNGTLQGGRGATAATRTGEGAYTVTFDGDISACALQAQQVETGDDAGATLVQLIAPNVVRVRTRDGGGANGQGANDNGDHPFHLTVNC